MVEYLKKYVYICRQLAFFIDQSEEKKSDIDYQGAPVRLFLHVFCFGGSIRFR